jgi:hypothetical protein
MSQGEATKATPESQSHEVSGAGKNEKSTVTEPQANDVSEASGVAESAT